MAADGNDILGAREEADQLATLEDRRDHRIIMQMTRTLPGVIRAIVSLGNMFCRRISLMRCITASVMMLKWPGLRIRAWATSRPWALKTPAERLPASNIEFWNAVRIRARPVP